LNPLFILSLPLNLLAMTSGPDGGPAPAPGTLATSNDGVPMGCSRPSGTPDAKTSIAQWTQQTTAWLRSHADPATGLMQSFAPVWERKLEGQGALYDQAIAAILLMDTDHRHDAERILDTLDRIWVGRGLPNYLALATGSAGLENTVHMGPTVWVGLAAYRYHALTGNRRYLDFARAIALWAMAGQDACEQHTGQAAHLGWIRVPGAQASLCAPSMGPAGKSANIVATEHVLDLFALTAMLQSDPSVAKQEQRQYQRAQSALGTYLATVAHLDQECTVISGLRQAPCLLAGGEGTMTDGAWHWTWNRDFNPSDIYFWWAAVSDASSLDEVQRANGWSEIRDARRWLDLAWGRFYKRAAVGTTSVAGMDYTLIQPDQAACCEDPTHLRKRIDPLVSVEWTGEAVLADRLLPGNDKSPPRWQAIVADMDKLGTCGQASPSLPAEERDLPTLAYPYASAGDACVFPTGWLSPRGHDGQLPGAIAGTVWLAYGYLAINPFKAPGPDQRAPVAAGYQAESPVRKPCPDFPSALDDLPTETVLAAAWLCLESGRIQQRKDQLQLAVTYTTHLLGRTIREMDGTLCANNRVAKPPVGLLDRARAENEAARAEAGACSFERSALNDVGTAYLVRALAQTDLGNGAAADQDVRAIDEYSNACFWQPPQTLYRSSPATTGEDRLTLAQAQALRSAGHFNRVAEAVCKDLRRGSGLCTTRWLPRLFVEGDAHVNYARNLFFIQGQKDLIFLTGAPRVGLRFNLTTGLSIDAFVDLTVVRALGSDPVDRVPWLNFWKPGGGLRLAINRELVHGLDFLRELNADVGVSFHVVQYFDDRAQVEHDITDTELLAGGSFWTSLAWASPTEDDLTGAWSEVGASALYSHATLELARQDAFRTQLSALAGLTLAESIEPYVVANARWNPMQRTDWDNNLRLGAGLRLPLWSLRKEAFDRFGSLLVRLDGNWQHTVSYWANASYVPTFRPKDDLSISLNVWGGWGSTRPATNQSPSIGAR
jgi:hypothetical protein